MWELDPDRKKTSASDVRFASIPRVVGLLTYDIFELRLSRESVPFQVEFTMATLQQQITEKFLAKLSESKHVDAEKIEQLRSLLADSKKLRADDLVKVFSHPGGGDLK